MKNILFFMVFFPVFASAQKLLFTPPDSLAVIRAHVKTIKLYSSQTNQPDVPVRTYHYNAAGQCITILIGTNEDIVYAYDSTGRLVSRMQHYDNKMKAAHLFTYFPDGKFQEKIFSEKDSIYPGIIYLFDTRGRIIREDDYHDTLLWKSSLIVYGARKEEDVRIDSLPGKWVTAVRNGNITWQVNYNSDNMPVERWEIFYNDSGGTKTIIHKKDSLAETFSLTEDTAGEFTVLRNGVPFPADDDWFMTTSGFLRTNYIPAAAPAEPARTWDYKHEITRDKKGNIVKDHVIAAYGWMKFQPVTFNYEYEYWP